MRQNFHAVPETDELYPLSINLRIDSKWYIDDHSTGGRGSFGFDTYKAAEIVAITQKATPGVLTFEDDR